MDITSGAVVVGVTGTGENTAALRYGLRESREHGRALVLAHAAHQPMPPPAPSILIDPLPWEQVAGTIVREVEQELEHLAGDTDVEVSRHVRTGPPGTVLVDLSEAAGVVVLQHRRRSRLQRLFTGSTVVATAANSRCPVVSVPADWDPTTRSGRVVVGVHEDGTPQHVLSAAFTEAAQHGWTVHLVHAWQLDAVYDDVVSAAAPAWDEAVMSAMREAAAPFREAHPTVEVEMEVRHEWTADSLLGLAADAELLVVGRHGSHRHLPHRIGSVARTLVTSSPCPVMVVPV
jgi:nucleotide-binding universal stress UspA family protein